MPKIPHPYSNNTLVELKKSLWNSGYRGKQYHEDAKLISSVKYWWDAETMHIGGHTVTLPAGSFYAYIYKYPRYRTKVVNRNIERYNKGEEYYDLGLEEKLGGGKEDLGW